MNILVSNMRFRDASSWRSRIFDRACRMVPDSKDTLFGRSTTPAERLRQHQRSLQKAQRELEREAQKLEQQEKKTMMDIKKNAKAGNMVRHSSSAMLSHYLCASARLRPSLLRCTVGNGDRPIVAGTLRIARPCYVVAALERS